MNALGGNPLGTGSAPVGSSGSGSGNSLGVGGGLEGSTGASPGLGSSSSPAPAASAPVLPPTGLPSGAFPSTSRPGSSGAGSPPAATIAPALESLSNPPAPSARTEPAYVPPTPLSRQAFIPASSQIEYGFSLSAAGAGDAKPLSLVDLVDKTTSRSRRTDAVQEYWKAAVALLDLRFAEEELRMIQGSSLPESPLKRAAIASARARAAEAKMELRRQREELASRYGAPLDGPLPLPADKPFVGPYDTKILGIYSSRRPPRDAIELDRLIAETAEIAAARGEAAAYAADARNAAGVSVEQHLAAFDRCRDARIAFLAAVRDYNLAIANYALYVSDPSLPPESVAKMLVDVPVVSSDPIASRNIAAPASPALVSLLDADQAIPRGEEIVAGAGSDPGAAVPPSLPPTEEGVQPATAIVPAQEGLAADSLNIVVDEVAVAPREIAPSDADEPIRSEAETSDFEPTPSGLRPAEETLAPTDSLEEIQAAPPVTGLQFSGAAVR